MNCKRCGKSVGKNNKTGYCQSCLIITRQEEKIQTWLNTGNTGMGVDTTIRGVIRDYILNEQGHKCAICGLADEWNNMPLNFVLDHIDGNAANSCRDNLRLVCPNCDSQLPTYKSKNKQSARTARKEYLQEHAVHKEDGEIP